MPATPKDKKPPDFPLRLGSSVGSGIFKSVRDRFHPGRRSPLWNPLTGGTLVNSPPPEFEQDPVERPTVDRTDDNERDKDHLKGKANADSDPSTNTRLLPFAETRVAFALDVSGSTAGKVLRVEKAAVEALSDGLTAAGKRAAQVLPWNNRARRILQLDELEYAESGGHTDPTVLLNNPNCKASLIRSDLWFLLTDGEIDGDLIRGFAQDIGAAQLHGTACVVVVFGSYLERPVMCNITVGKSVFAVAPDCLFLFHDFETGEVRILQAKGHFRILLPEGKKALSINYSTTWNDLPRFDYSQIHAMEIPRPRRPEQDTVILSNGEILDLNDIYNNSLDDRTTQKILSRYEDLDTLILTANTRGRADDVRSWVNKQRIQVRDPLYVDRPKDEGTALSVLQELLRTLLVLQQAKQESSRPREAELFSKLETLKEALRGCHRRNWELFLSVLGIDSQRHIEREELLDVLDMSFGVAELESPNACSPVSGHIVRQEVVYQDDSEDSDNSGSAPALLAPPLSKKPSPQRRMPSPPRRIPHAAVRSSRNGIMKDSSRPSDLLFLKGYQAVRKCKTLYEQQKIGGVYDTCGLCGEADVILCLLFRAPPTDTHTNGFPPIGAMSRHKYPLVLGNYPETDIIVPLLCCDACSSLMVEHRECVGGDEIVAALPLISLANDTSKSNWLSTLSKAFLNRFDNEILVLVLLSVICGNIDDLAAQDSRQTDSAVASLKQACHYLSELPCSDLVTTTPGWESPLIGIDPWKPLRSTIEKSLSRLQTKECQFLYYPLDGFIVLVHVAATLDPDTSDIYSFVWLRTLYHFTEKYYALRATVGEAKASRMLQNIISNTATAHCENAPTADCEQSQKTQISVPIARLEGTCQLSSEDLATFKRLGDYFSKVQSRCGFAISAYLHLLIEYGSSFETSEGFFASMKSRKALACVFWNPDDIDEAGVVRILTEGRVTN